jgi:Cys-tRNA(Pro)/Cys-tRNA(Cys) deacylase
VRFLFNVRVAETRGTRYLRRQGVDFEVLTYEHAEKGAAFAAAALGIPLGRFAKTLVAEAGGDPVFALVPGDRELSLKKLAQASGARQATMADPRDAERVTGYVTGGISPFGARRALPTFVEESLLEHSLMALNAGQRGVILELEAAAVVDLLGASVCALTA